MNPFDIPIDYSLLQNDVDELIYLISDDDNNETDITFE
jgi:hypothetical protein